MSVAHGLWHESIRQNNSLDKQQLSTCIVVCRFEHIEIEAGSEVMAIDLVVVFASRQTTFDYLLYQLTGDAVHIQIDSGRFLAR
jgi:hypothetical protein